MIKNLTHKHITLFQIIILRFMSIIILGSVLLMLPFATRVQDRANAEKYHAGGGFCTPS